MNTLKKIRSALNRYFFGMKPNQDQIVNIDELRWMEAEILSCMHNPHLWKTLDVDYYPPRVERLWTVLEWGGKKYRVHLHLIHKTEKTCLFHKHRWPAVFKQVKGAYETAFTYSKEEIDSDAAHNLPSLSKVIIVPGSYQEMTQTDCLHYVKPITDESLSIMVTYDLYPEAEFRKEAAHPQLKELTEERKLEILKKFTEACN